MKYQTQFTICDFLASDYCYTTDGITYLKPEYKYKAVFKDGLIGFLKFKEWEEDLKIITKDCQRKLDFFSVKHFWECFTKITLTVDKTQVTFSLKNTQKLK